MRIISFFLAAVIFFSCSKDSGSADANAAGTGTGGSLARFTIVGDRLFVADHRELKTFEIRPGGMILKYTTDVGFGIETIYPYKDKLFLGSVDGMYIYNITATGEPQLLGTARHTRSCDPVVANDSIAFVTLRGGQPCGPAEEGLYIYNIRNLTQPQMIKLYAMQTPNGLGLQDSMLYVCQKANGLSVFNVSNPANPVLRKKITNRVFEDVICYDNILISYVSTGIALYDISTPGNPVEITTIAN